LGSTVHLKPKKERKGTSLVRKGEGTWEGKGRKRNDYLLLPPEKKKKKAPS